MNSDELVRRAGLAAAVFLLTGISASAIGIPGRQQEDSVAYQINTAHSGGTTFSDGFAPPLKKLWSQDLGGQTSYALVADSRVYVVAGGNDAFALDLLTGNKDWEHLLGDTGNTGAYDRGNLFFVNSSGQLTSLKAGSGKQRWAMQLPDQWAFSSPPIAAHGEVFTGGAGSGGTVYGVDETTGALNWTQGVANGDDSSPAFGDGGIYVVYPCQTYKIAPSDGSVLWHYSGGCDGGGGSTASYYQKRVYVQDPFSGNIVFNAKTGATAGTYAGSATPSFFSTGGRSYGLSLSSGKLYCFDVKTGNVAWSFSANGLNSLPVVINNQPVVGSSSGDVYMLDGTSGSKIWSGSVSSGVSYLSAGEGTLVVTAGSTVTVFAPK